MIDLKVMVVVAVVVIMLLLWLRMFRLTQQNNRERIRAMKARHKRENEALRQLRKQMEKEMRLSDEVTPR